jgi:hypothetical protein
MYLYYRRSPIVCYYIMPPLFCLMRLYGCVCIACPSHLPRDHENHPNSMLHLIPVGVIGQGWLLRFFHFLVYLKKLPLFIFSIERRSQRWPGECMHKSKKAYALISLPLRNNFFKRKLVRMFQSLHYHMQRYSPGPRYNGNII